MKLLRNGEVLRSALRWRQAVVVWLLMALLLQPLQAVAPDWWVARGMVTPGVAADDYALLNQGQLKTLVRGAVAELDESFTGGAGPELGALLAGWRVNTAAADDYAAVTLGQLKTVVGMLHTRLRATGRTVLTPWTLSPTDDDDYALVNLGQAKTLFAIEIEDTDHNGLPDNWEMLHFGHIGVDPNATALGGGMTNRQHFILGSNPNEAPPPPLITAGTATLDQSAATLLYPAADSQLLLKNGNFSAPSLGTSNWKTYPGIPSWTALSGSLIELQKFSTLAIDGQYAELDAHWPTSDHTQPSDHGIQQTLNLARGHYLLFLDYRGRRAGADSLTAKLKTAGSSTDVVLLTKTAASITDWKRATVSVEITGGNPNLTTFPITLLFDTADALDSYGAYIDNIILLPVDIVPDFNRDGKIDAADKGKVRTQKPWRWWKNDDDDQGALVHNDLPGSSPADSSNTQVDGLSDLVDLFPLYLDIASLLTAFPPAQYMYRLDHPTNAFGIFETDLSKSNSREYLRDATRNVVTRRVGEDGRLDTAFLSQLQGQPEKGVVLLEVRETTTSPLALQVWKNGAKLVEVAFPVSTSGVEQMYRHLNLLSAAGGSGGRANEPGEPSNYPDDLCINKNFVFLHGYNVNPDQARGWVAETFKRLFQSGSKSKYVAVTWHGAQTQLGRAVTINYHINVVNALNTSEFLAKALSGLSGEKIIAAHSLGNMVVSSALSDWNAPIGKYIAIDAALPIEAWDGGATQSNDMVHREWDSLQYQGTYPERLWASEWHKLWLAPDPSDHRGKLTWRDRFANFGTAQVFNFYSSGEEVLAAHPHDDNPEIPDIVTSGAGRFAWALGEKTKGRMNNDTIMGSHSGGWGFNSAYSLNPIFLMVPSPAQTASITDPQLRAEPFFRAKTFLTVDLDPALFGNKGSQYAHDNRKMLLARAFPARTLPVGANPVPSLGSSKNYNMHAVFKTGWPQSRIAEGSSDWHHNDMREVAYPFIYKMFDKIVNLGGLDQ